jgi:hypothetical protein
VREVRWGSECEWRVRVKWVKRRELTLGRIFSYTTGSTIRWKRNSTATRNVRRRMREGVTYKLRVTIESISSLNARIQNINQTSGIRIIKKQKVKKKPPNNHQAGF